jgi:tRNA pseudouridine55 synthase
MALHTTYKKIGETPLQALERLRKEKSIPQDEKMTYAGRLDPMAEGLLLVLSGNDILEKSKFLSLEKEYEFVVLFGVSTDTADTLGLVVKEGVSAHAKLSHDDFVCLEKKFAGDFEWEYPVFSSKTVRGKPLFEYARKGLEVEIPKRIMSIKKITCMDSKECSISDIVETTILHISSVGGDFRQTHIIEGWNTLREKNPHQTMFCVQFRARVSSGTYIRTLAEKMGESLGVPACALSIKRISVGEFTI